MYVKHINNLVLYAKNFYVHSDNVIVDVRRMYQLDNPEAELPDDDEFFLNRLNDDFNLWINSMQIEDNSGPARDSDESVSWCTDPIEARIHSILISYDIYIPFSSELLNPPVYSMDPMLRPQLDVTDVNDKNMFEFARNNYEPEKCIEAVRKLLSKSRLTVISDCFDQVLDMDDTRNKAMRDKSIETIRDCFDANYTEDDFEHEIRDAESKFFEQYLKDVWVEEEIVHYQEKTYTIRTRYFEVQVHPIFTSNNHYMSIVDVNFMPYSVSFSINERDIKNNPSEMLDIIMEKLDKQSCYDIFDKIIRVMKFKREDGSIKDDSSFHIRDYIKDTICDLIDIETSLYGTSSLKEQKVSTGYLCVDVKHKRPNFYTYEDIIEITASCDRTHGYMVNRLYNTENKSVDGIKK